MTVNRAVGLSRSSAALWTQGRGGGGVAETEKKATITWTLKDLGDTGLERHVQSK